MQAQSEFSVPIQLIEATLNSELVVELMSGSATHLPALHLVGELVRHTQDAEQIQEIIRGCLPLNYDGNTIGEIPRMVADTIKNGFAAKNTPARKSDSAAKAAMSLIEHARVELFHTEQQVAFVAMTSSEAGTICYPLHSRQMEGWLRLLFYDAMKKPIPKRYFGGSAEPLRSARSLSISRADDLSARWWNAGRPILRSWANRWFLRAD